MNPTQEQIDKWYANKSSKELWIEQQGKKKEASKLP